MTAAADALGKTFARAELAAIADRCLAAFAPPPEILPSRWADAHRRLSSESSAEPGAWDTDRAPYQREMMDAVADPDVARVVFCTGSQLGKSEILLNVLAFHIATDPGPMLFVMPTLEMANIFSKDRLAPMIRDTPSLRRLIADPRARDTGNTALHKLFTGGQLAIIGANSPAGLASRPIRILLADEVDRYPMSAGAEGDPLALATARQSNFFNRRTVFASTPTLAGASRIWRLYEGSDQRTFQIHCPNCAALHPLLWAQVKWPKGDPAAAHFDCPACRKPYTGAQKNAALAAGKWIAGAPFAGTAGFHLNALYSPFQKISETVAHFLQAKESRESLKAFTNLILAECWEEQGDRVEFSPILAKAKAYPARVPPGVLCITAGVDVQQDRFEVEVVGWGEGEESWGIEYKVIHGDTQTAATWADLDAFLQSDFADAKGRTRKIDCVAVDSGHATALVYQFTAPRQGRRVFAVKGSNAAGAPPVARARFRKGRSTALFIVGGNAMKESIFLRLKMAEETGPRTMHFPTGHGFDEQFFLGLTSEEIRTTKRRGFTVAYWHQLRRNEPLDCRVYAMAALGILAPNWQALVAADKAHAAGQPASTVAPVRALPFKKPGNGFVNAWR